MYVTMIRVLVAMAVILSMCEGRALRRWFGRRPFHRLRRAGCYHNGRYYRPGPISRGFDRINNHCYGSYCNRRGRVISWNNWNCHPRTTAPPPTTTPPTTTPPTTTPPTTTPTTTSTPPGCIYQGSWYPLNSEISRGEDRASNWCWVVLCDDTGQVLHGDNFNCFPTTTTSTTAPPTTTPGDDTTMKGCIYEGSWYPLNTEISRGEDRAENWCWVVLCDDTGQVLHGDDFNCFPTTTTSTTTPPTTTRVGDDKGCIYEGSWYPLNSEISRGQDPANSLCWVVLCDDTGQVLHGDYMYGKCFSTTTTAP